MSLATIDRGGERRHPLGRLQAHRLIDTIGLRLAPAAVGGLLAAQHSADPGIGVITFVCMLTAANLLHRSGFPLGLLPAARVVLALAAPALGIAATAALTALAGRPEPAAGFLAPLIGAWLVLALGAWTKLRLSDRVRVRVAVAGTQEFARDLAEELAAAHVRGYEVMGWLGPDASAPGPGWLQWLGPLDDVRRAVLLDGIDLIVCAPDVRTSMSEATVCEQVASACLDLPVRMLGVNQFYEDLLGHVPIGTIDAAWYRYIMHPRFRSTAPLSKRVFDLVVGAVLAIVALPIVAAGALAVRLGDGAPAFYRQRRMGERGTEFQIVKLRTMRVDAEAGGEARWAEADDERVTPVGRFLRRTHIDELPQLLNVLRGQMTLVGPRPERPEIVEGLERALPHYTRRQLVKPGVTGWAAVRCGYAGSQLGTAWKLCHDLFYVKHRSVLADSMILLETGFVTFRDAHRALRTPRERFILGEQPHG